MALNGTKEIPTKGLALTGGDLKPPQAADKLHWPRLERLSCHKAPEDVMSHREHCPCRREGLYSGLPDLAGSHALRGLGPGA